MFEQHLLLLPFQRHVYLGRVIIASFLDAVIESI